MDLSASLSFRPTDTHSGVLYVWLQNVVPRHIRKLLTPILLDVARTAEIKRLEAGI